MEGVVNKLKAERDREMVLGTSTKEFQDTLCPCNISNRSSDFSLCAIRIHVPNLINNTNRRLLVFHRVNNRFRKREAIRYSESLCKEYISNDDRGYVTIVFDETHMHILNDRDALSHFHNSAILNNRTLYGHSLQCSSQTNTLILIE
ncbi:hypothetical protein YC2023_117867 [Brassica napus]